MAKVKELNFEIKGTKHKINVNCTSAGIFTANLPQEVADALRMDHRLTSKTLAELEQCLNSSVMDYLKAQTVCELYIIVAYQARGCYNEKKDGGALFYHDDPKYRIESSFNHIDNAIGIDYRVVVKETIDGNPRWFGTHYINGKYEKSNSQLSHNFLSRGKAIPFNEAALNTLEMAQEKFRELSEMLFNFINQDEEQILLTLTQQRLLTASNTANA